MLLQKGNPQWIPRALKARVASAGCHSDNLNKGNCGHACTHCVAPRRDRESQALPHISWKVSTTLLWTAIKTETRVNSIFHSFLPTLLGWVGPQPFQSQGTRCHFESLTLDYATSFSGWVWADRAAASTWLWRDRNASPPACIWDGSHYPGPATVEPVALLTVFCQCSLPEKCPSFSCLRPRVPFGSLNLGNTLPSGWVWAA